MSTQIFCVGSLGLALLVMPLASGCSEQASGSTTDAAEATGLATNNYPATFSPTDLGGASVAADAPGSTNVDTSFTDAPATIVSNDRPLPAGVRPNSVTGQVIQLANSGTDEGVILSFVNNSASSFNLSADEIVYLKDVGITPQVITAMLQRDQALKQQPTQLATSAPAPIPQPLPAPAPAPAPEVTAAAPTYSTPPAPPAYDTEVQPVPQVQQPVEVTDDTFNSSLAPYGAWVDVQGYGRCWQPTVTVINAGWRPYSDGGRWVYTDCGWYWYSDYSWGWAPFHYGRWFQHARLGWCWAPGNVWGPSWVSWRYNDSYCGWAPLPPAAIYNPGFGFSYCGRSVSFSFNFGLGVNCFTFVPLNRVCEPRVASYCVPRNQCTTIYNHCVVNTTVLGSRNSVMALGVPRDRVAAATHNRVPQIPLRDIHAPGNGTQRGESLDHSGGFLSVYRPRPSQGVRPASTMHNTLPTHSASTTPSQNQDAQTAMPRRSLPTSSDSSRFANGITPAQSPSPARDRDARTASSTRTLPTHTTTPNYQAGASAQTTPTTGQSERLSNDTVSRNRNNNTAGSAVVTHGNNNNNRSRSPLPQTTSPTQNYASRSDNAAVAATENAQRNNLLNSRTTTQRESTQPRTIVPYWMSPNNTAETANNNNNRSSVLDSRRSATTYNDNNSSVSRGTDTRSRSANGLADARQGYAYQAPTRSTPDFNTAPSRNYNTPAYDTRSTPAASAPSRNNNVPSYESRAAQPSVNSSRSEARSAPAYTPPSRSESQPTRSAPDTSSSSRSSGSSSSSGSFDRRGR